MDYRGPSDMADVNPLQRYILDDEERALEVIYVIASTRLFGS